MQSQTAASERLERRILLDGEIAVFDGVNEITSNQTIQFATVDQGGAEPSRTLVVKNLGSDDLQISGISASAGGEVDAPPTPLIVPANSSISLPSRLQTDVVGTRSFQVTINNNDANESFYVIGFSGQVRLALQPGVNSAGGSISATNFRDTNGNVFRQPNPSTLLIRSPSLMQLELSVAMQSNLSGGIRTRIARDVDLNGSPSIAELEDAVLDFTGTGTANSAPVVPPGQYCIYTEPIFDAPNGNFFASYTDTIVATVVAPPIIEVLGLQLITDDDTTPSTADGTSFGEIDREDPLPTLTFKVSNTGGSTLAIDGDRPDVTGDFTIVEGLVSVLGSGESDTFTIRLIDSSEGARQGTITIQSLAALGGDFVFKVGGTVKPAAGPGFAVLDGTTLTITGTGLADQMTSTVLAQSFHFALNGADSDAFDFNAVNKIVINLLDGDDSYSSATQLDIRQTINGGNGNDLLRGGKQVDRIFGSDGNDRMDGRSRGDTLDGGGGSDVALYRQRRAEEPVTVILDALANDGGAADLNRDFINPDGTEHVYGGRGNDRLTGSSKTNRLFGFEGNDTLVGLKGNDTIEGGEGNNDMNGGFGSDTFFSRNTIVDVIDGGADSDTLIGDNADIVTNVENQDLG